MSLNLLHLKVGSVVRIKSTKAGGITMRSLSKIMKTLCMAVTLLGITALGAVAADPPKTPKAELSSSEESKTLNIAVIKRLFSEGFAGGHEDVLDQIFDQGFVFEDPSLPPGIEGLKAIVRKNNHSFAGWHFILHEIVAENDRVAVRWTGTGTHVNPFLGEKPTNKQIKLEGISIYYMNHGKIQKDTVVVDNLGFLRQLGVIGEITMIENPK